MNSGTAAYRNIHCGVWHTNRPWADSTSYSLSWGNRASPEPRAMPGLPPDMCKPPFLPPLVPADRDVAAWTSPPTQRAPGAVSAAAGQRQVLTPQDTLELVIFYQTGFQENWTELAEKKRIMKNLYAGPRVELTKKETKSWRKHVRNLKVQGR